MRGVGARGRCAGLRYLDFSKRPIQRVHGHKFREMRKSRPSTRVFLLYSARMPVRNSKHTGQQTLPQGRGRTIASQAQDATAKSQYEQHARCKGLHARCKGLHRGAMARAARTQQLVHRRALGTMVTTMAQTMRASGWPAGGFSCVSLESRSHRETLRVPARCLCAGAFFFPRASSAEWGTMNIGI